MEEGGRAETTGDGAASSSSSSPDPRKIRQHLVDLAVKFLNNPRVSDKPMEDKKNFLRKKGTGH